jgi:hypothetical protein
MSITITEYNSKYKTQWDNFVQASKNGTFLFCRDYMEYHSDRFVDTSLMLWDEEKNLLGIFPANKTGSEIISHQGLTYGGLVVGIDTKTTVIFEMFDTLLSFLQNRSFDKLIYKVLPHVYHCVPAEEDLYILNLCNAKLLHRNLLTVVSQKTRLPYQKRRLRGQQKAVANGLKVNQTDHYERFWIILEENLKTNHDSSPVHSYEEISYLKGCFPEHIKLYGCYRQHEMLAGVVIFETSQVARSQYIAASELGKKLGALDLLFMELLDNIYKSHSYFDFGSSNIPHSAQLSKGLVEQKEGFGGRTVAQDLYELCLTDWESGTILKSLQ